jgi:thioesterase domain-containing protein/acyl carrier protein
LIEHPQVNIVQICLTSARRSPFNHRLAIAVNAINPIDHLCQNLTAYLSDRPSSQVFSGIANPKKYKKQSLSKILTEQEPYINQLIQNYPEYNLEQIIFGSLALTELNLDTKQSLRDRILKLWINGVNVDWHSLYTDSYPQQAFQPISLPSYPFERQSFWVQNPNLSSIAKQRAIAPKISQTNLDQISLEENFVAPSDRTERKLAELWENTFKIKPIGIHDNFFDLGGTSLIAVNLFAKIEQAFKVRLSLVVLFQCPTIAQLADLLKQLDRANGKNQVPTWSTLVPIRAKGVHRPLFCVSGIHGNVLLYADLAKHLGSDQPFYGLQSRGLDGIQSPHTTIEAMANDYIEAIRTIQPHGPYFLGGFSLGSYVVWEMAQQLHQQGEKVALLALFDGRTRSVNKDRLPFRKRIFLHYQKLREMGFSYIYQKVPSWKDWLIGRYFYWTKRIVRRFCARWQLPLPLYFRQSAIEESLEKAGAEAMKKYVIQVYPDKAVLFRADTQDSDQGVGFVPSDWDLGWGCLTAGGLDIETISGDHISMFREPHVQILAQKLKEYLLLDFVNGGDDRI